jgi:dihydropteroate synthase
MTNLELEERTTEENPEEDYIVVAERRYPQQTRPTAPDGDESAQDQTEKIIAMLEKEFGKENVSIRPRLDKNGEGTGFFQICVSKRIDEERLKRIREEYKFPEYTKILEKEEYTKILEERLHKNA